MIHHKDVDAIFGNGTGPKVSEKPPVPVTSKKKTDNDESQKDSRTLVTITNW